MIDTHAHLLYFEDVENVVDSMKENELDVVVTIGTTVEDSIQNIELAEKFKNVYAVVGIYPEYSYLLSEENLTKIEQIAKHEKVVAIGEIGLDYHGETFNKQEQKELFIKQLEIANKLKIPFCVHCRNAVEDVYEILKTHEHLINHSGIMHCYSEGGDWVHKFLELGLYISFSGNITYKKSDRSFLKDIPLDKILVETDAPYLSPEPYRGRINKPEMVNITAKKLADEIGVDYNDFKNIVTKNAKNVYFKMK